MKLWCKKRLIKIFICLFILFIILFYGIKWYHEVYLFYNPKMAKGWIKYKDNPVVGNQTIGTVFDPFVMQNNNGKYMMYLSLRSKNVIALTESDDGISWSDLKIVLNNNTDSGWEDVINRATVVYKDNKYHMWYTGQKDGVSKIGYAISNDGYSFVKVVDNPVLVPEYDWEMPSVMNPHVIYDESENIFKCGMQLEKRMNLMYLHMPQVLMVYIGLNIKTIQFFLQIIKNIL